MCNVLPVILRANFDDPVDSAQDIVDRNLTLFDVPWSDMWKQWLGEWSKRKKKSVKINTWWGEGKNAKKFFKGVGVPPILV